MSALPDAQGRHINQSEIDTCTLGSTCTRSTVRSQPNVPPVGFALRPSCHVPKLSRTGLKSGGFVSSYTHLCPRPAFWGASPLMGPKAPKSTYYGPPRHVYW
eukprot:1195098-Prorocentrum_minimum.AAC.5